MTTPTNIDATYADSGTDASVQLHQQHHDLLHALRNGRGLASGVGLLDASGDPIDSGLVKQKRRVLPAPVVAAQCWGQVGGNTASQLGTSREQFVIATPCTDLRLVYTNQTYNAGLDALGASITISAALDDGTNVYPLTFNGSRTVSFVGGPIVTDPIGLEFAAGAVVYARTYLSAGSTQSNFVPQSARSEGLTNTTDLTGSGSAAVGFQFIFSYGPAAIIGTPNAGSTAKAVGIVGDSIAYGQGDGINGGRNSGFVADAIGTTLPYLGVAQTGESLSMWVAAGGHRIRGALVADCPIIIASHLTNDRANAQGAASMQTNVITLAQLHSNRGSRTFQCVMFPRTTSTDGWATVAGQTVIANEAARTTVNAWLRAGAPIDPTTKAPVAIGTGGALLCAVYNGAGTLVTSSFGAHPLSGGVLDPIVNVESGTTGLWLANGRRVTDGAMTAASATLTSATAAFVGGDVGVVVRVNGAGAAGGILDAVINSVTNATTAVLNTTATTAVTAAVVGINTGTYSADGVHPSANGNQVSKTSIPLAVL